MESLRLAPTTHSTPTHTSVYEDIGRFTLDYFKPVTKQQTLECICTMQDPNKQALLLSKLIAIKYYRQDDAKNVNRQDECWRFILDKKLVPENAELVHLMALIKNEGFWQSKIPKEFSDLLLRLTQEDRDRVLRKFGTDERETIRLFLVDATGENWDLTPIITNKDNLVQLSYLEFEKKASKLTDYRWVHIIKNYNINFMMKGNAAKATVDQMIAALNMLSFDNYLKTGEQVKQKERYAARTESLSELKDSKSLLAFVFYDYSPWGPDKYFDTKDASEAFGRMCEALVSFS